MDVYGPKDGRFIIRASDTDRGRLETAVYNMLTTLFTAQQEYPKLLNDPHQKEMIQYYKDQLKALKNPKEV